MIAQCAEMLDFDFNRIARAQENLRRARRADARRRAGRDYVAGFERHNLGKIIDDNRDVENEIGGRAVLHRLAV